MRVKKISRKKFFIFLIIWTIFILAVFKFRNDYLKATTELNLNKKYYKVALNENLESETKVTLITSSKTCDISQPKFDDLRFDNIYWQTLITTNTTIKIFSAFYDDRNESDIGPSIRIIAMIKGSFIQNLIIYCQLWFNNVNEPIISEVVEIEVIWKMIWGWDENYFSYLIACPFNVTENQKIPTRVSIVNKYCDQPENILDILNYRPENNVEKKPFTVCVRALNYIDDSMLVPLVEWIELLRIFGVEKIFIYQFFVPENIRKVFDFYERYGILKIIKLRYPLDSDHLRQPNELVALNDCFYRNMYLYDYIGIFDIDEVIMPIHPDDMTWFDLLKRIKQNETENEIYSSYNFQKIYVFDDLQHQHDWDEDLPYDLHILQHLVRPKNYTANGYSSKSFHNTNTVKTVHHNFPISCFEWCDNFSVNTNFGHLAHYSRVCPEELKETCDYYKNNMIEDRTAWKYKEVLKKQIMQIAKMIGSIKNI